MVDQSGEQAPARHVEWEFGSGEARTSEPYEHEGKWVALVPATGAGRLAQLLPFAQFRVPLPGARRSTVGEFVGGHYRRTKRYGDWIEIPGELAHSHPDLLIWCRRFCNSELPSGTFRFSPSVWDVRSRDPIDFLHLPELDHPSETIRNLAAAERIRRRAEEDLRQSKQERDKLIRQASDEGCSRRQLANLLGISFGRVQQVVATGSQRALSGREWERR